MVRRKKLEIANLLEEAKKFTQTADQSTSSQPSTSAPHPSPPKTRALRSATRPSNPKPVSALKQKAEDRRKAKKAREEVEKKPMTFEELAEKLDPTPELHVWKKLVDRNAKTIMFYRIDVKAPVPRMSTCVQIKAEKLKDNPDRFTLVPSVFINQQPLLDSGISELLGHDNVESMEDLKKIMEQFGVLSDMGKRTENGHGAAAQGASSRTNGSPGKESPKKLKVEG